MQASCLKYLLPSFPYHDKLIILKYSWINTSFSCFDHAFCYSNENSDEHASFSNQDIFNNQIKI